MRIADFGGMRPPLKPSTNTCAAVRAGGRAGQRLERLDELVGVVGQRVELRALDHDRAGALVGRKAEGPGVLADVHRLLAPARARDARRPSSPAPSATATSALRERGEAAPRHDDEVRAGAQAGSDHAPCASVRVPRFAPAAEASTRAGPTPAPLGSVTDPAAGSPRPSRRRERVGRPPRPEPRGVRAGARAARCGLTMKRRLRAPSRSLKGSAGAPSAPPGRPRPPVRPPGPPPASRAPSTPRASAPAGGPPPRCAGRAPATSSPGRRSPTATGGRRSSISSGSPNRGPPPPPCQPPAR